MQNDLQLSPGELRLGKEFGRKGLDLTDPARNKVELGELLRQLVTEGTFNKQYRITWEDLVPLGAVNNDDVALVEDVAPPDWLIADDAFLVVVNEFAGAGITAVTLELNLEQVPAPTELLPQTDIFTAAGPVGLGGSEKGAALQIITTEGKPTALMYGGLTATIRTTGANFEDLTAGEVLVIVLGKKALNPDALEIAPLP
jgi:hypothetical protein